MFLFPYFDWFQLFFLGLVVQHTHFFFHFLKIPEEFVNRFLKNFFFWFKEKCRESYPLSKKKKTNKFYVLMIFDSFDIFFFLWLILFPSFHLSISFSICSWSCVCIYTWCVCKKTKTYKKKNPPYCPTTKFLFLVFPTSRFLSTEIIFNPPPPIFFFFFQRKPNSLFFQLLLSLLFFGSRDGSKT